MQLGLTYPNKFSKRCTLFIHNRLVLSWSSRIEDRDNPCKNLAVNQQIVYFLDYHKRYWMHQLTPTVCRAIAAPFYLRSYFRQTSSTYRLHLSDPHHLKSIGKIWQPLLFLQLRRRQRQRRRRPMLRQRRPWLHNRALCEGIVHRHVFKPLSSS